MMKRIFLLFALIASVFCSSALWAIELLTWERLPLTIPLVVGQERAVFIDRNVRIGMDAGLVNVLRVQSAAGTIYLKAEEPIAPSRIQVQVVESGEVILLDVVTVQSNEVLEPIRIVDARLKLGTDGEEDDSYQAKIKASQAIPAPVALTRYAAQSLYAPMRTVVPIPGLKKVSTKVNSRLRLHPTEAIIGFPLVAYSLGGYTVTAVKLVNTGDQVIKLDPRKLQGDFYATTFQHNYLDRAGTAEDTTVVYLVTKGGGLDRGLLPFAYLDKEEDKKPKKDPPPFATDSDVDEGE